LLLAKTRGLRQ